MSDKVEIKDVTVVRCEKFGRFTIAEVTKIVELKGKKGTKELHGYGVSRQADSDTYSAEKAQFIAIGRACKALGKKIKGKTIHELFLG